MDILHFAKVERLVVDTNSIVKNYSCWKGSLNHFYCVDEVIKDVKDAAAREWIRQSEFVHVQCPSSKAVATVTKASKTTGDYAMLSLSDLKTLALVVDLQWQHVGLGSVNVNVTSVLDIKDETCLGEERTDILPAGFVDVDTDEEGEWLDEKTLPGGASVQKNVSLNVACMTDKFSIQKVLMHMNLDLISVEGRQLTCLNSFMLRCRSCYRLDNNVDKEFCSKCGNKTLYRVSVSVNSDGTTTLHMDSQQLEVTKGLNNTRKEIRGGKHDNCDRFFEDQRIPQNRLAKMHQENDDSPFCKNDVTSRSAVLGIRSQFHSHADSAAFTHAKGRKKGRRN